MTARCLRVRWGIPVLPRCYPQPRQSIPQGPVHIQKILNLEGRGWRGGHRRKYGIPFLCPMLVCASPREVVGGVFYDAPTWESRQESKQERESWQPGGAKAALQQRRQRGTLMAQKAAADPRRNDWHAPSLAKTTQTPKKGLRVLAAREHTDNDTDNIYIYIYT